MIRTLLLSLVGAMSLPASLAHSGQAQTDPFASPLWNDLAVRVFEGAPYVFDDRVVVSVPKTVENQAQVPVIADARALAGVRRLIVFADRNPIQLALSLEPVAAAAFVGLRMKIEESTPVRAAALLADGSWHVGGIYLDAAGGGCTAPALARGKADWSETLGNAQGRVWPDEAGYSRVRFRIRHPMDTGLAKDNTPAFFIELIDLRTDSDSVLAKLHIFEPVGEDPTLTLLIKLQPSDEAVAIDGRDNNGQIYRSSIPARLQPSLLGRPPS